MRAQPNAKSLYFFLNHLEAQLSASLHIVASTPQIISPIKATKHTAKKWREDNKEEWKQLSAEHGRRYRGKLQGGVYMVITDKGIYIGQTAHLRLRIKQHR